MKLTQLTRLINVYARSIFEGAEERDFRFGNNWQNFCIYSRSSNSNCTHYRAKLTEIAAVVVEIYNKYIWHFRVETVVSFHSMSSARVSSLFSRRQFFQRSTRSHPQECIQKKQRESFFGKELIDFSFLDNPEMKQVRWQASLCYRRAALNFLLSFQLTGNVLNSTIGSHGKLVSWHKTNFLFKGRTIVRIKRKQRIGYCDQ